MTDEDAFLAHVQANPADAVARLAYADWLDEHGDADAGRKAEYLRTDHDLAQLPADAAGRDRLIARLRGLSRRLPNWWKATVARVPVENCGVEWSFRCPKTWDQLLADGDADERRCPACDQTVYFCETVEQARVHARHGRCVALDVKAARRPGDLRDWSHEIRMGDMMPDGTT